MGTVMASRLNIGTRLTIEAVLAIGGLSTANAQFSTRQSGSPCWPAKDAKDLRAAMGILRGIDEHEVVATLRP
jgi:hypothetical protein